MNLNDFKEIKRKIRNKLHYDLIKNTIKNMDYIHTLAGACVAEHSKLTTICHANSSIRKDIGYYIYELHILPHKKQSSKNDLEQVGDEDQLQGRRDTLRRLEHLNIKEYSSSTALLLEPMHIAKNNVYVNIYQPVILTKSNLFNIISKYGFITAHQLESDFVKAMHRLSEESAMSVKKKVNLSRHYLAIKAAVPDNAIFNISSLLKGNDSTASLMQSASFVYTDIREAIPYIQKESKKANQLLHDIQTIINKQIDGQSAYMMFETTQLELNEKYMKMNHKQLANLIRKNKLV